MSMDALDRSSRTEVAGVFRKSVVTLGRHVTEVHLGFQDSQACRHSDNLVCLQL